MVYDLVKVYNHVKKANLRWKNKREFEKEWHVILHYSYFFFHIYKEISFVDDADSTKAFNLFLEMCRMDMKADYKTYAVFQKEVKSLVDAK